MLIGLFSAHMIWRLQGFKLHLLPPDIFGKVLQQLDPKQQSALRLVNRHLAASVPAEITSASTSCYLSGSAAHFLSNCPHLVSLKLSTPVSTFHLHQLTRLTRVIITPRPQGTLEFGVDLAPLEALPRLHTLHLEHASIQHPAPGPFCVWGSLTQLQQLQLVDCMSSGRFTERPADFAALRGMTHLQVLDRSGEGLHMLNGLSGLHKVGHAWACLVPSFRFDKKIVMNS